jgi:hypothetical protein
VARRFDVFPVAPSALLKVTAYIENQEMHHRERTLNAMQEAGFIEEKP